MRKSIKDIFDLIANEPGTNKKMEILDHYKENPVLRRALYLAMSKRIKFYMKQIPAYKAKPGQRDEKDMPWALKELEAIIDRKVTGHDAVNHLVNIFTNITADDAYIIERIIDKDCKIGMGSTNVNKIFPKLIEKTPYMGAQPYDPALVDALFKYMNGVCYSQIKMDGRYCNAIIRGGDIELESRQGEPNPLEGAAFLEELKRLPDCVLNGELTMEGFNRYESNGIIASLVDIGKKMIQFPPSPLGLVSKKVEDEIKAFQKDRGMTYEKALGLIRYTVWDTITIDEYFAKLSKVPYEQRLATVQSLISGCDYVKLIKSKIVTSKEEALAHFDEVLNAGEEGTILKAQLGTWKDGKPNWQVKFKLEMDVDLEIIGFNYGTGKNEHVISSLTAKSSDGKVVTRPTGIDEKTMKMITENQDTLMGAIVETKCCGLSKDSKGNYALLHPVFKKIRDDKKVADDLKQIQNIENMAKGLIPAK